MGLVYLPSVPEEKRFSPRVDKKSIDLKPSPYDSGEDVAAIYDNYLYHDEVVLWNDVDKRFYTNGVSVSELQYINGVSPGNASAEKALIASDQRTIGNLTEVQTEKVVTNEIIVYNDNFIDRDKVFHKSLIHSGGDLKVDGLVESTLEFNSGQVSTYIKDNNGVEFIDYFTDNYDDTHPRFGDFSRRVYLKCESMNDAYIRDSQWAYKIWNEGNDGSNSGLDADKLDGYDWSDISGIYGPVDSFNKIRPKRVVDFLYTNTNQSGDDLYDFFNKNENNINEGDRMMVSGGWTDSKGNWSAAYVIKNTQNSMELVGVGGDNDVTVKTLVSGDSTTMIYRIAIAI